MLRHKNAEDFLVVWKMDIARTWIERERVGGV